MSETRIHVPLTVLECERLDRVSSLLPKRGESVLEIGARHGVMTELLARIFDRVTALDLTTPTFQIPGVKTTAGDVQSLGFPDDCFEYVVCTEVLEHVPDVARAANEICRVCRSGFFISVPYRQDTRVGRTTCLHCGKANPPYGHINTFDEQKLQQLFPRASVVSMQYVSENRERTNSLSTWLQDVAGNPYGTYDQEEPCIYCGSTLARPETGSLLCRAAAAMGVRIYDVQYRFNQPRATWIMALFAKA